jgi:hypothetical protein
VNICVFGIDPGGHTGIAWGIFDPKHDDGVPGALADRMNSGSATIGGSEREQIRELADIWESFYNLCCRDSLLPVDHVFLAVEDFVLKPGETAGGKDSTISLSLIWGLEGYRMGRAEQFRLTNPDAEIHVPQMHLQLASQAKAFLSKQRQKEWGVWVVGREHERSAWAHVALFLKRYTSQVRT